MHEEIKTKKTYPTFSVRVVVTDTEKKFTFTGDGDKYTSELFLRVLRRLDKRIKSNNLSTESFYDIKKTSESEIHIFISKENMEELLQAILLL